MDGVEVFDLVCLGSGPAGQKAAVQAARAGFRAAVIEREERLGGFVVLLRFVNTCEYRHCILVVGRELHGLLGIFERAILIVELHSCSRSYREQSGVVWMCVHSGFDDFQRALGRTAEHIEAPQIRARAGVTLVHVECALVELSCFARVP